MWSGSAPHWPRVTASSSRRIIAAWPTRWCWESSAWEADCHLFAMASWHAFKQSPLQTFMIRRMGAFSVFREGNDRQAIDTAIDILVSRRRPLIMFPEGAITRHNDLIEEMMEGPSFIARQAAKRLKKQGESSEVVIHPVAIRYAFQGDMAATLEPVLEELEQRFTWQPQKDLTIVDRIDRIGHALLALKEVEYLGEPRSGNPFERAENLVQHILATQEVRWKINDASGGVIARVKRLRTAILADMIAGKVTPNERAGAGATWPPATTPNRCRTIRATTSCARGTCRSVSWKPWSASRRISPTTCACTSRFTA